jgi:hypothetical protein
MAARRPIVHLAISDKFMAQYVEFVNTNFDSAEHRFLLTPYAPYPIPAARNVVDLSAYSKVRLVWTWVGAIAKARKVILHGLFDSRLVLVLSLMPWWLHKCNWVMWGGDLYSCLDRGKRNGTSGFEWVRRRVISRLGGFVTQVRGDYDLACQWYGVAGKWHECFMYPSNLYCEHPVPTMPHETTNILVGNSADPSNAHIEVLDKLYTHAAENIRIYCPLSYGDATYAREVAEHGRSLFGDKFVALSHFMPFEEYQRLLAQIDIAIFNHNRQQGMGNITTLLGLGKKVYMRTDVTSWDTFQRMGVRVYDVASLDLGRMDAETARNNRHRIAAYFSEANLKKQMQEIFQ